MNSTNNSAAARAHPIMIFFHLKRFALLWIIPILRALFSALKGDLSFWSQGLWVDLLVLFFVFLFAILRWWLCIYSYSETSITQREGLFFTKTTTLDWDKISVLKVIRPFYLRPIGALVFHADTIGGSYRKSDINICLSKKRGDQLLSFYYSLDAPCKVKRFTSTKTSILSFALVSTNSFVGFFYLATFISQSGRLLGEEFSEMLIGSFVNLARTLSRDIPPAAGAIAYLVVFAWFIGVIFTIFRYYGFTVERFSSSATISGGLLGHHKFVFNIPEINYISIHQNIVTYILNVCSVFVHSVGAGKERSDLTCILPSESKKTYNEKLETLLPEFKNTPHITIKPTPMGFMRFLFSPIMAIVGILVLLSISLFLIPSWSSFIRFVAYMLIIPCVGFFIVRLVEYRKSGLGKHGDLYKLVSSTGFSINTLLIPKNRISGVKISQSWIQVFSGNCDVYVYTVEERKNYHKCRNLKTSQVIEFFNMESPITDSNIFERLYSFLKKKYPYFREKP